MRPEVPPYTYRCVDRSPLVGPFCRYGVRWFVQWMPPAVPANLLTLGSSACMWVMLGLAVWAGDATWLAPWCLGLMAGYVIYDHADGMHSRRTGTSSPLGEFLDHYTDAFHGSITVIVMFLVAGRGDSWLLVLLVGAVALAGAATMVEEKERGELYFAYLGPLEGMLLALGFFASWCHPAAAGWWHAPLLGEVTRFETIMLAGAAGSLWTTWSCVRRIGRVPRGLVGSALTLAALGGLGWWSGAPWWVTALLLTLHGADYTGRVITSHLRGTPLPWPDLVAPAGLLVAWAAGVPVAAAAGGAAAWLLARNVTLVGAFFAVFGVHWRWWNRASGRPAPMRPVAGESAAG